MVDLQLFCCRCNFALFQLFSNFDDDDDDDNDDNNDDDEHDVKIKMAITRTIFKVESPDFAW